MLERNAMDTSNVYYMDKKTFISLKDQVYKPGIDSGFRFIQIRCYDNSGKPIMQWASCEGYLKDLGTFRTTPPKNHNGLDTTLSLYEDLMQYCDYHGTKGVAKVKTGYDYSLVVFFATWTRGLLKKNRVFDEVNDFIKDNPDKKIIVYKINYDNVPFWNTKVKTNLSVSKGRK